MSSKESKRPTPTLVRMLGAEFVGTFGMVFAGCGAIMTDEMSGGTLGVTGVGLTFGLVVMVMVYATSHISGAHFNPAVTVAFASMRRISIRYAAAYVMTQVVAALGAALLLSLVLGSAADLGSTFPHGGPIQSFALEVVLTFMLMFVITAVATDPRASSSMGGVAIGATVALAAIFGGPVSGASMNPARSIGPAVLSGQTADLWIYLLAPVAGALAGAWAYRFVGYHRKYQSNQMNV